MRPIEALIREGQFYYCFNETSKTFEVYALGEIVSRTGTEEQAKKSLDFYENLYYNPLYSEDYGIRGGKK